MTTAAARTPSHMTVGEFLDWSEEQADDARYELVAGVPVRLMATTNIRHARIQRNVSTALRNAAAASGLPCEVFDAGPGVAVGVDGDECRIPDVAVTCAAEVDEAARLVPEPVIIVEVASPSTRLADVNDKVEFYGGIVSIQHYLVIEQERRRVVYHGRGPSGGLEPRILRNGEIALDPPGIRLAGCALSGHRTRRALRWERLVRRPTPRAPAASARSESPRRRPRPRAAEVRQPARLG
jgi:Uma2 family endonuclease